jgi:succinate dehydrogenase / fumarate reductase, membrane anchor subunit
MSDRRASGLWAWVLQRVSAVYLALCAPLLLWRFLLAPPADYHQWRDWLATPWVSVVLLLFLLALLLHAWVGIRDVVIDYVRPLGARLSLLTATALGLTACGLWGLRILLLVVAG